MLREILLRARDRGTDRATRRERGRRSVSSIPLVLDFEPDANNTEARHADVAGSTSHVSTRITTHLPSLVRRTFFSSTPGRRKLGESVLKSNGGRARSLEKFVTTRSVTSSSSISPPRLPPNDIFARPRSGWYRARPLVRSLARKIIASFRDIAYTRINIYIYICRCVRERARTRVRLTCMRDC